MNNIFVTSNSNGETINYAPINGMDWLYDIVTTDEAYEKWVQHWKVQHKALVEAIQFFKKEKNRLRDAGQFSSCHNAWNNAVTLGEVATEFYNYRDLNKFLYHNEFDFDFFENGNEMENIRF